jgi:hypothetical protein
MKKTIFAALMLLSFASAKAQPYVDLQNNSGGDMLMTVYAVASPCGAVVDFTVPTLVNSGTPIQLDLGLTTTWNSGTIPGSYDIAYAVVSRDPSCGTSSWWGTVYSSGNICIDEVVVGDPACAFSSSGGIVPNIGCCGGLCGGLIDGNVYYPVNMTFGTWPNLATVSAP